MDSNELMHLISQKNKENTTLELKRRNTLRSRPGDIAEGLVSLANRDGGRMLIGVKDSGELDGKYSSSTELDQDKGRIDNICTQNCSPPIDYTSDIVQCQGGDVLVVNVQKRREIPHAVIKKKGGEIKERIYYIRTSHGKRLVTDSQLASLFKYTSEPGFSRSYTFQQVYDRETISFPHWKDFPIKSILFNPWFSELLRQLSDEDISELKKDDSRKMSQLFIEILPFAALHDISLPFSNNWNVSISKLGNSTSYKPVGDLPKREISIKELVKEVDLVFLPKTSVKINSIRTTPFDKIVVPDGVTIDIEIQSDSENSITLSSLNIRNEDEYGLTVNFGFMGWSVGLPWKHPIWSILNTDSVLQFQKKYAHSIIQIQLDAYLNVYDYDIQKSDSLLNWMNNIDSILDNSLNWESYVSQLPTPILYRIDYNLRQLMGKDYFPFSYLPR